MRRFGLNSVCSFIAFAMLCAVICTVNLLPPSPVFAQLRNSQLPKSQNYNERVFFNVFYPAEYGNALKIFNSGARGAYKTTNGTQIVRYLDSIVFWTMIGECYYHMGDYARAIEMYDQSLVLYMSYQAENWQARIQLPAKIPASTSAYQRAKINWGTPSRTGKVANAPSTFKVMFGRLDASRSFSEGGLVDNPELKSVDVTEIMRCTSLCIHRRTTINGALGKFDPFNAQLVSSLSTGGAGGIVATYNGVLKGLALASSGEFDRATSLLNNSLRFDGMDHALTPVALLEIARIGMVSDKLAASQAVALEASYSAAMFNQYDLVEESLSLATTIHLMNARTEYPPLRPAIQWANSNKARLMEASLTVRLAECYAEAGDAKSAAAVLRKTSSSINSRNSLPKAVVNARAKYVAAVVQFLNGNFRGGSSDLAKALSHFQTGSLWLYRLNLANKLIATNKISQRQADQLYSTILRDPTALDWKTDPLESIAFLASAHVGPMQLWFDIVADRKDHQRALEIGDMVRRHRFFSNLPLGGRLMAFRWVMHAPIEALSGSAEKQRANFMNRNPAYRQSIARAEEIRKELIQLPIQPEPRSEGGIKHTKLLKELAAISETQEAILASFALRREPADMVFPPQGKFAEFQDTIDKDQLALVILETGAGYHIYLVGSDRLQYVGLLNSKEVTRSVGKLLKELGVGGAAVGYKELLEEEWKETAGEIKTELFGAKDDAWKRYKELVIVPDGAIWYLPFEALPVEHEDKEKYLSDIVNIRYCPSMFMAFGAQRPVQPVVRSVVVTAKMHSRGEAELSSREFGNLARELPDATRIEGQLRIPSNYLGALIDQLIVWSDMKAVKSPLALLPMQIDKDKNSNSIANWMSLPWRGPEHVTMPGFNSDGGAGMRGGSNGGDLFLTSMGMLASGTRTTLISRWATGGKTSLELTLKYAESLPTKGPIKSAQISRQATRELEVDFENEPRVRVKKSDATIKAEHPFFWAAHMLIAVQDAKRRVVVDDMENVGDGEGAEEKDAEMKGAGEGAKKIDGDGGDTTEKMKGDKSKPDAPKIKADEKAPDDKKSDAENSDNKKSDNKKSDENSSDVKKDNVKKSAAYP